MAVTETETVTEPDGFFVRLHIQGAEKERRGIDTWCKIWHSWEIRHHLWPNGVHSVPRTAFINLTAMGRAHERVFSFGDLEDWIRGADTPDKEFLDRTEALPIIQTTHERSLRAEITARTAEEMQALLKKGTIRAYGCNA